MMAARTQQADEDLMLRPPHHGITEVVISAGDSAGGQTGDSCTQKRGALRRTKFKEMLSRSLSSAMPSKNKSSPAKEYDAIHDDTMAPPTDRNMDNFPMSQVDMAHQATDHIYETERDGDSLEHLAEKYATLLCTLAAKTIELSFVTVFVALLGQILTRRAFIRKAKGVTLAEMTMRNWVIQPGSLLTYWEGIPYAAVTLLGILTLSATICSMFYTTASDAMVSPKLKYGDWESRELDGLVRASYANPFYIQTACTTPIDKVMDPNNSAPSCLDVQYSGQSYHNLLTFMSEWQAIHENGSSSIDYLGGRPNGKHNLFDNTTMVSSWIEQEFGKPEPAFAEHGRIINNVTLAMPHPGVYAAATDPRNDILQPDDLAGVGEYSIRASVVSPVVNVMCVNMARDELGPLVYTTWPQARTNFTEIPGQRIGADDWFNDVPPPTDDQWLNRTAVDDIFRWGPKYQRRPPVFQLYPINFNMITNTTVALSDSVYILAKSGFVDDFTLCELRSWVTSKCSTEFDVSGISGSYMRAHCEDPSDANSYAAGSGNNDTGSPPWPVSDWRNVAEQWRLSMDLNGGTQNNNASNARILANLVLRAPRLDPLLPSMSEALAVLASSTLVSSSLGSTYRMAWTYEALEDAGDAALSGQLRPGVYEPFRVAVRTQQYTSSHTSAWHAVFYPVLGAVFLVNLACLVYLVFFRAGLVTDYTEPQNLFAVAVNSPPSRALAGSCGHGPDVREMVVPWRVGYSAAANHYFFEQAGESRRKEKKPRPDTMQSEASGSDLLEAHPHGRYRNSYKRLSGGRTWL
ncbi:Myo-inositol-1-phosphate synthase [Hypoxylon texense]